MSEGIGSDRYHSCPALPLALTVFQLRLHCHMEYREGGMVGWRKERDAVVQTDFIDLCRVFSLTPSYTHICPHTHV